MARRDQSPTGGAVRLARCVGAFEREFDYVYRTIRRHGVGEADAEDVAQDVFMVMWRRWDDHEDRPPRPWLARVAFHLATKSLRRSRRELLGGEIDTEDESPGAEERPASGRARALAMPALGTYDGALSKPEIETVAGGIQPPASP